MITFLTSEAGISLLGLVIGWFFRAQAERNKAINDLIAAKDSSMNKAASRTKDGGTWMRRALYGLVAFVFITVLLAPFLDQPVIVENVVQKGILFWKRTVTEFVTINGVLFPSEIRKAFLLFMAYYMGQGTK